MSLYVKKDRFEALCDFRSWRYPLKEMAKLTGMAKSYLSDVLSGKTPVSVEFMMRYTLISGCDLNRAEEWGNLFEFRPFIREENDPKYNNMKLEGKLPYRPNSTDGLFRLKSGMRVDISTNLHKDFPEEKKTPRPN